MCLFKHATRDVNCNWNCEFPSTRRDALETRNTDDALLVTFETNLLGVV
jgi:hypothetical protein